MSKSLAVFLEEQVRISDHSTLGLFQAVAQDEAREETLFVSDLMAARPPKPLSGLDVFTSSRNG